MQQFLRIFLDIVLWRRGPQDLPASPLLVWLTVGAYVLVNTIQLALLDETAITWFVFLVVDPAMLLLMVWSLLRFYGHAERFQQTASAVFGTGALLGLVLYLPLQVLLTSFGLGAVSTLAQVVALVLVVVFALVTGRILKLATGTSLFTGIAVALVYFLLVNTLAGALQASGG